MNIRVGTLLFGFCNGYFSKDSYDNKRVEAFGADWIVARELNTGEPVFATFESSESMEAHLNQWAKEAQED